MSKSGPIGIFDSGYGGLTVFKDILDRLPQYDYIYLGDNARTPYGTRSLEKIYEFTLEGVNYLFSQGSHLVILACNTASASALRRIQQEELEAFGPDKRVLGVIRPTTERLSELTRSGHLGICATEATVNSKAYLIEAQEFAPEVQVHQQACPLWVPLVENGAAHNEAALPFIERDIKALLEQDELIDSILLGCTHYPLLYDLIRMVVPSHIDVLTQGELVASSLEDYLHRHQWMADQCSRGGRTTFLTTDESDVFDQKATIFFGEEVKSKSVSIGK